VYIYIIKLNKIVEKSIISYLPIYYYHIYHHKKEEGSIGIKLPHNHKDYIYTPPPFRPCAVQGKNPLSACLSYVSMASKRAVVGTVEVQVYVLMEDRNITAEIVEDLACANMVGESVHARTVWSILVTTGH
jgi:hypothetical protein